MATVAGYSAHRRDELRLMRLRRARGAWIWGPSLVYALVLALNAISALTPARLSLALSVPAAGQARVSWVLPGGALWNRGVRAGDAVLTLDGRPPVPGDAGLWTGRQLRVHAGAGVIIEASPTASPARATWPMLLLSPWFLLLATLIVLRAPQRAIGRAAYLLFTSAAYALALAPGADAENVVATGTEWAATALFAVGFVNFFLTYPLSRGASRPRLWLFGLPLVGVLLGLAALSWPALYAAAYLARMAVLLGYLLLGTGLLVRSFLTVRDREARRGLVIIGVGAVASVLPLVALYLLPTVFGQPPVVAAEQAILALGLLPVSFAYAILRHHILDVRLLQRWFVRGVLWGSLLALCIIVAYVAEILPPAAAPTLIRNVAVDVALMVFAGVSVTWLREKGYPRLDRLLFKDGYDYRGSLERLSRDLSLAGNLGSLGARLPGTLRQLMNLDFAVLLVHDAHGTGLCGDAGIDQPDLLAALVATAGDVMDEPRAAPLAFDDRTVLIVPLRTHDMVVGHLCLGQKATGEPFRAEDRALLTTLSGHLAAIVRNAQLVDDLHGKIQALDALNERLQRAQEEERARLAADLHDEPLQTALALQRQIAIDGHDRATTARHVAASQDLIAQLRALCTAMRPAALDHLGLHAALDQLARERGAHAGFPIMVDADPEIMELDVPAAAEIVLYRATQEALTNCVRHARPRAVRIALCRQGDGVRLVVADDGAGFVVPDRLDDLVEAGHLGLAGLRARVQHAGGHCRVTSAPGEGTVVQVDLPLGTGPVEVLA